MKIICFVLLCFMASALEGKNRRIKRQNVGDNPDSTTTPTTTTTTATNTTTTTTAAATTTDSLLPKPTNDFSHIVDLLGPRKEVDLVFILSRSKTIWKRTFYEKSRFLMRSLIQLYSTVHANYTRVAVISYAQNHTLDYDDIRSDSPLDKCSLFPTDERTSLPLDTVKYLESDEMGDCAIYDAYDMAEEILKKGKKRRPNAAQVVVLLSNVLGNCEVKDVGLDMTEVKVFGIILGAFQNALAVKSFVSSPYSSFAAQLDQWMEITEKAKSIKRESTPLYTEIPGNASCGQTGDSKCFCNVDDGTVKACKSEIDCLTEVAGRSCSNQGSDGCAQGTISCLDVPNGTVCYCTENFYGQRCQYYSNPCRFPDICDAPHGACWGNQNGGGQFKCNCTQGYEGDFCQDLKPTTFTTPQPKNVTRIFTVLVSVTPVPFDATKSIVIGSVFGGLALLAIIIGVILCAVCYLRSRAGPEYHDSLKKGSVESTSTGVQSVATSAWPSKYSTVTSRLSQLFAARPFGEGMPSVPNRMSATLSAIDMQNVSHEETMFQNELIHDNRQILKSWKSYLDELVSKGIAEKAAMASMSTKEAASTARWVEDWDELTALWGSFGSFGPSREANVQSETYSLEMADGDYLSGFDRHRCSYACLGRSSKYLVVAVGRPSNRRKTKKGGEKEEEEEGKEKDKEECLEEIKLVIKHIKSEGF